MLRMNRNAVLDAEFLADPRVVRNWPFVWRALIPVNDRLRVSKPTVDRRLLTGLRRLLVGQKLPRSGHCLSDRITTTTSNTLSDIAPWVQSQISCIGEF